ncbi:hypothetical protein IHE44_0013748 [Lamprotornis superbus]|uniref:Uncharacterized protein n=1 Tax=Lamprotornis superbus TaxID=245042 RepID=A0A835P0E1_9PASS|nr:hypothetical protein IHE44_0013748 [Lamprotornis superbus]
MQIVHPFGQEAPFSREMEPFYKVARKQHIHHFAASERLFPGDPCREMVAVQGACYCTYREAQYVQKPKNQSQGIFWGR